MNDKLNESLRKIEVGEFIPLEVEMETPFEKPSDSFEIAVLLEPLKYVVDKNSESFPKIERRRFQKCPLETPEGAIMAWKRVE